MTLAEDVGTGDEAWDGFVDAAPTGAYLQLSAWARVKAANGWDARRLVADTGGGPIGAQLLTYRRRLVPLGVGYAPRGPIGAIDDSDAIHAFTDGVRRAGREERLVEVTVDPEVAPGAPLAAGLREAGWRPVPSLQPDRSRILDLTPSEDDLWLGVRSKWRQYVNKARRSGVTVEDAGEAGLTDFYGIYVETAQRAGFVVRSAEAYAQVYRAFAPRGRARLLLARLADGTPAATLMLLDCGARVVEPYGGMTTAGADARANYLLKWEAIRLSRERGMRRYDMWGLAHPGIEHFKAGFGGEEVQYAGAFSLVLNSPAHRAVGTVRRVQVAAARRSQGIHADSADDGTAKRIVTVTSTASSPPPGWDAGTVDIAGGSVLQGAAWAAHRAADGWTPWFVTFEDERHALVLVRPQPPLPGLLAYAPRGPVSAGDAPDVVAARAAGLGAWARSIGAMVLAADPELDASDAYEAALARAGFSAVEEIQPSRHRMLLDWPAGTSADDVLARVAKQTRQRIRAAERGGTSVHEDPDGQYLDAFAELTDATADRKGFAFAQSRVMAWWRAVLAARQARFWVARHEGSVVGGLIAYRQGGHLATAYSADRADLRRTLPGTMHLLRWSAIKAAIEAGDAGIDLGGVDVRGARVRPAPGDPQHGLYEHKASFGAVWVESAPAHEIILRPWAYRASRTGSTVKRAAGGRR